MNGIFDNSMLQNKEIGCFQCFAGSYEKTFVLVLKISVKCAYQTYTTVQISIIHLQKLERLLS